MNIDTLIQQVLNYSPESDPEFLRVVYSFAAGSLEGHELAPGVPGIDHALGTAMVLTRLLGTNVRISPTDRLQTLLATLEISSAPQLKRILTRVKGLPSVSDARRIL